MVKSQRSSGAVRMSEAWPTFNTLRCGSIIPAIQLPTSFRQCCGDQSGDNVAHKWSLVQCVRMQFSQNALGRQCNTPFTRWSVEQISDHDWLHDGQLEKEKTKLSIIG
eukprot:m.59431 g.59431  ORF g.59431 m.59431 type:complete len:108 (-) comp9464_c0_seq2:2371-2694(-)